MNTAQQILPDVGWFDVTDPNSPDLDELARRFHLHELQIEDCRHRPQRAKVDEYGTYLFAVLKHLVRKNQGPRFDDFDVFLGPDFLITVHQGDCAFLTKLCIRVQQTHVARLDRILYEITDLIVDEYLALLDDSSEDISKVESLVLERPDDLRHRGGAAGDYHRVFRNEPASTLEQQSARGVVCERTHDPFDRGGALVFQEEAVVLRFGREVPT